MAAMSRVQFGDKMERRGPRTGRAANNASRLWFSKISLGLVEAVLVKMASFGKNRRTGSGNVTLDAMCRMGGRNFGGENGGISMQQGTKRRRTRLERG